MPCYHPLQAWLPVGGSASKKVLFKESKECGREIRLPCGQCIGCRLEYSRQWAIRCMHESKLYKNNCFITLTFDDDHLPSNGSLDVKYFQDFMRSFRKAIKTKKFIKKYGFYCKKLRYFHCGEYGEKRGRPHYHACIFNFDFPDRKFYKRKNGFNYYTSELLSEFWPFGMCIVADFSFETAAYVARYVCKKVNGIDSNLHYAVIGEVNDCNIDMETGEIIPKKKEYVTMSRNPGIGKEFYLKFKSDIYPSDSVALIDRKVTCRPPKYYDSLFEIDNPESMDRIKVNRENNMKIFLADNTRERLLVKEKVHIARCANLKRDVE